MDAPSQGAIGPTKTPGARNAARFIRNETVIVDYTIAYCDTASYPLADRTDRASMYQLLIVEDNEDHARILQDMVGRCPCGGEFSVDRAFGIESLEARCADGEAPDVLLMDIELGPDQPNGIEAVRRLFPAGCKTQVIYVSGYVEYCTPVYRTEHVYFLAKPVAQVDFDDALAKAFANLEEKRASLLPVRTNGSVVLVSPGAIGYVESDRRKVRIHMGSKVLETYATLSGMEAALPASFVRCHKSFLVNMDHIAEFRKDCIALHSGETVPMSQTMRKPTKESFLKHLAMRP